MKTTSLGLLLLTTVCGVLALPANAATDNAPLIQNPGRGSVFGDRPPRLASLVRERLADLDSNNDGKISLEEFLAPRLNRLDKLMSRLDKNGDGLISQDELHPTPAANAKRPVRPNPLQRPAPPAIDRPAVLACIRSSNPGFDPPAVPDRETIGSRFENADTNGDGKLSLAELSAATSARAQTQFKRLDKDNDGYLTAADRKAAQAERAALAKTVQDCVKAGK